MPGEPIKVTAAQKLFVVRRDTTLLHGARRTVALTVSGAVSTVAALFAWGQEGEWLSAVIAFLAAWAPLTLYLTIEMTTRWLRARPTVLVERLGRTNATIDRLEVQYHEAHDRIIALWEMALHLHVRRVSSDLEWMAWKHDFETWQGRLAALTPLLAKPDHRVRLFAPLLIDENPAPSEWNSEHHMMRWELYMRSQVLAGFATSEYSRWSG